MLKYPGSPRPRQRLDTSAVVHPPSSRPDAGLLPSQDASLPALPPPGSHGPLTVETLWGGNLYQAHVSPDHAYLARQKGKGGESGQPAQ